MRSPLYRKVCVFDGKCDYGDGELLFSFDDYSRYFEGTSCTLGVREFLADRSILVSEYKVTLFFSSPSSKIIFERNQKSQLVSTNIFVFEKPSPQASWVLLVGEDEKLISHAGNHSLTMLANEFTTRTTQEH